MGKYPPHFRMFGDKRYALSHNTPVKSRATKAAERIRKHGELARVVKTGVGWSVYSRWKK